jgi:hypothetical protein
VPAKGGDVNASAWQASRDADAARRTSTVCRIGVTGFTLSARLKRVPAASDARNL